MGLACDAALEARSVLSRHSDSHTLVALIDACSLDGMRRARAEASSENDPYTARLRLYLDTLPPDERTRYERSVQTGPEQHFYFFHLALNALIGDGRD